MILSSDLKLQERLMRRARQFAFAVLLIAVFSIVGSLLNINFLYRPLPNFSPINPISAVLFILSSISFFIFISKKTSRLNILAHIFSIVVLLFGIMKISGHILNADLYLDRTLFPGKFLATIFSIAGEIAPVGGLCFVLVGIALTLLNFETRNKRMPAHYLTVAIGTMGLFALVGHLYHAEEFYKMIKVPMSIYSAICFLLFSIAVLFAHPDKGMMKELTTLFAGSITARRLIPVAVFVPVTFGILRIHGERAGWFSTELGVGILAVAVMSTYIGIILYNSKLLNKRDLQSKEAEAEVMQLNSELELKVTKRTEELRQLLDHVQTSREEERKYIAREIHDELGAALTALKIDISMMSKKINSDPGDSSDYVKDELASILNQLDKTILSVKKISYDLRPEILDHLGIYEAIKWRAQQFQNITGIPCEVFCLADMMNIENELATAVYRTVQEALTNIARHAKATLVSVVIKPDSKNILIEIKDNGRGIEEDRLKSSKSLGLIGMRERARILNGTFSITSNPGQGTTVSVIIPMK